MLVPHDVDGKRRISFMLLGLAAIGWISLVMAIVLNRSIAERLLIHEAEVSQEFLSSALRSEANEASLFAEPAPSPALAAFASYVQNMPDVIRANVYSPDGFIRFSTEKNIIGVKFENNPELAAAFAGRLSARLEEVSDNTKPEHLAVNRTGSGKLIEAYIPIVGRSGSIVSVVEFYRPPHRIEAVMTDISTIIRAASLIGGLIMFLAFYFFFIRNLPESANRKAP